MDLMWQYKYKRIDINILITINVPIVQNKYTKGAGNYAHNFHISQQKVKSEATYIPTPHYKKYFT